MAYFSKFTATTVKNFFSTTFKRASGVNQLATIDQVNTVIDYINTQATTELFTIAVTHPIGMPIVYTAVAATCETGAGSCPTCCVTPCAYKTKSSVGIVETLPGIYTFTISPGTPGVGNNSTNINSYLKIGNFNTIGSAAAVEQTAPFVFTVTTFNSTTGIIASNLFNSTIVEMHIISSDPDKCS